MADIKEESNLIKEMHELGCAKIKLQTQLKAKEEQYMRETAPLRKEIVDMENIICQLREKNKKFKEEQEVARIRKQILDGTYIEEPNSPEPGMGRYGDMCAEIDRWEWKLRQRDRERRRQIVAHIKGTK